MKANYFIPPILKDRVKRITFIKEATQLSLYKNKSESLVNNSQEPLIFNKVKQENLGSVYRPHNFYWKSIIAYEKEDIAKRKYFELAGEQDQNKLKIQKEILKIVNRKLDSDKKLKK